MYHSPVDAQCEHSQQKPEKRRGTLGKARVDVLRGARSCRRHARKVPARLACPPSHSPCEGSRPQLAHRDAIRAGRGAARGEKRKPRHSHMLTTRREFIMIPAAPLDSGAPGWALSSVPVSPAKLPGRAASWSAEGEGACWSSCVAEVRGGGSECAQAAANSRIQP